MKYCPTCKTEKDLSQFYKNKTKKDGYAGQCSPCYKLGDYGTTFTCTECTVQFSVKHRNVNKRKYKLCELCTHKKVGIINTQHGKVLVNRGYAILRTARKLRKTVFLHRIVVEAQLGRKLKRDEVVHHIDGDKLNNDLSNLWLTDNSMHTLAHDSLEKLGMELFKKGIIKFDPIEGKYKLS